MKDYVVFDLETTGFSPERNEIIEIGAWKIKDGVSVEKFNQLVAPTGYLPLNIQQITGITPKMLKDAEDINSVLPQFYDFCGDLPLLGHNLPFDYSFIKEKGKSLGLDFTLNCQRQGIDILQLARQLYPNISHKLGNLADHLGVHIETTEDSQFHRAGYDAYVTKLIYDIMLSQFPALRQINYPTNLDVAEISRYGEVKNNETLSFS